VLKDRVVALFSRRRRVATAAAVYAAIVAQSRRTEFYSDYGVPDTPDGRFDLIVLHQALLVRRLAGEADLRDLAQAVLDAFFRDMDGNLREMGVGDLAVPKKMLAFGEAFYGRLWAYDKALDAGDGIALAAALARNIYGETSAASTQVRRLAAYVVAAEAALSAAGTAALMSGTVSFADPVAIAATASIGDIP
jgi:cytochrome b pre-mRNA-processing protein 3